VSLAVETGAAIVTLAANTCNAAATDAMASYWAQAVPVKIGSTGQRSFATDSRGTIFFDNSGVVIANPIPPATSSLQ
jgi:hypothetical protein